MARDGDWKKVPAELKALRQWVNWEYEERGDGEPGKPPLDPKTGGRADISRPETWAAFEEAVSAYRGGLGEGIGFVIIEQDPYAGSDLDDCFDPESGQIEPRAKEIIDEFSSYTERTPSGLGFHVFVRGSLPPGGRKRGDVEFYDDKRYFTITGDHLEGTPETIEDRQEELERQHARTFGDSVKVATSEAVKPGTGDITTENLVGRLRDGPHAEKFERLMSGDHSDYESQSEADLALCGLLASVCGADAADIDSVFRQSGLYRDKWDEPHYSDGTTFGEHTIKTALEGAGGNGSRRVDQSAVLGQLDAALRSSNPTESLFSDMELIGSLALLREVDGAAYARAKSRLKGLVNIPDFERAVKAVKLRVVGDDEREERIPLLREDGRGYSKQRWVDGRPVSVVLSNFTLHARERITMPGGQELLRCELIGDGGDSVLVDFSPKHLINRRDLLERLPNTYAAWLGTDRDVQLLRVHLSKQPVTRMRGYDVAGRHGEMIAVPGLVIGREGPLSDPPVRLVTPRSGEPKHVPTYEWPTDGEHRRAASAVYEHLPQVNDARVVVSAAGWVFALPWAALIRKLAGWGGFPHLVLWGSTGSGKTATAELLLRLCGVPHGVLPFSVPSTPFVRLATFASTNLVPVFMDEYRPGGWSPSDLASFHDHLRSAYGGEVEARGRKTLELERYELVAPLILAGEDRPRDPALEHRMLVVSPPGCELRSDEARQAFMSINEAPLEAFTLPFWSWALAQDGWVELLNEKRAQGVDLQARSDQPVPERITNNVAIMRFGWEMFERYAGHLRLEPTPLVGGGVEDAVEAAMGEAMPKGKGKSNLDTLMRLIASMVSNERLRLDVHYAIKDETSIVLPLQQVLPEVTRYARDTGHGEALLGEDAYKRMVKEMAARPGGYVKKCSAMADFRLQGGGKRNQRRGILVDVDALEGELEIDRDVWFATGGRQTAGPIVAEWNGMQAGRASN